MSEVKTELTTEQKLENLARNIYNLMEEFKKIAMSVDNVYIQMCTLLEILSKKELINPEIWEETLKEVTDGIKKQMEQMIKDGKIPDGEIIKDDTDGSDETAGTPKIIVPNSKIIVPGQE